MSVMSDSAVRPIIPAVAPMTAALSPVAEPMVRVAAASNSSGGAFLAARSNATSLG